MAEIEKLSPDNIVFIFIDLQERLFSKIPDSGKIVSRNVLLLECGCSLEIPILVTTQYQKGLGGLIENFGKRLTVPAMDKTTFSCSGDARIRETLARLGREWTVLGGIETHICVLQTALDLLRDGYKVAVVSDATGARKEPDHEIGLKRMERAGALIVTSEMLIYELLGRSDSEIFKKLLPLIKGN